MDIPLIALETAYHLGTLDPGKRGSHHSRSYEGAGISVSLCPDAWEAIARLGGSPLFALTRGGAAYVDLHALEKTAYDVVARWAEENGLAKMSESWLARYWDEEHGSWRRMELPTRERAVAEALFMAGEEEMDGPGDEAAALKRAAAFWADMGHKSRKPLVEALPALRLTEAGSARACGYGTETDAWDIAAMFWAEDVVRPAEPGVVGVWWREDYSPENLSAPRGAVFQSALADMERSNPVGVPGDFELLATMPRTRRRTMDTDTPESSPSP